ncbi:MAG TPA: tryptophan synthase subunit alpha [Selenomonadales bacterium]|nr:tryptophan synthase subunit alpha [Selenomonadales bacterium]
MSRLTSRFSRLKEENRKGLIVYITAGCPDFATTLRAVRAAEAMGADIIELGIPFSDPMADGPVIQKAAVLALQAGATSRKVLELVGLIRRETDIPVLAMTYVNTILQYGVAGFARDFGAAGMDGVIVPDLPAEEADILEGYRQAGIDVIQFIAPTTAPERIAANCRLASGFIYCISNTGVTGVREVDYREIGRLLDSARRHTPVPLALGFGIGDARAAQAAAQYADAVIVGSAVMDKLMTEGLDGMSRLVAEIRRGLDEGA